MPIPSLNEKGFLPPGVHDCSMEEVRNIFGCFNSSDRRPCLFRNLEAFFGTLRAKGVAKAVVLNGSFTTAKADPNDIDMMLVLAQGHNFAADPTPDEYNCLSGKRVKKKFGFDMFVAEDESQSYERFARFFQEVKNQPGESKGVLRVEL